MKALFTLFFIAFSLCISPVNADTLYSRTNGNWSSTTTWSYTPGGPSCGCIPLTADVIIINHYVTLDISLINQGSNINAITGTLTINAGGTLDGGNLFDVDIRSTGILNLCGTFKVRNMTFSNGCEINICPSGVLTIAGDFFNKNNSNSVFIDGTMTVGGSFTNGVGSVITGTGSVVVTNGPLVNNGTISGCTPFTGCPSFPCDVLGPCGNPLPIELINFSARCESSNCKLNWVTASETNNDYFSIEHSANGEQFEELGKLGGAGNSSIILHYQFTDFKPYSGICYYRLKQTDFNGHFTYSKIVAVKTKNANSFSVYPTQLSSIKKLVNIKVPANTNGKIQLISNDGKIIVEQNFTSTKESDREIQILIPEIAGGVYTLLCKTELEKSCFRLVLVD